MLLPFIIAERLLKTNLKTPNRGDKQELFGKFRVFKDELFFKNLREVAALRKSCGTITNYIVTKRVKRKALLNRMTKKQPKILKLQAVMRGHICRVRNKQKVDKIRRDGQKGTRKYKAATKIQSLFRGFAFRVKRRRALERLANKTGQADGLDDELGDLDPLMGDADFDAEAFLGVKPENLEKGDIFSGANADLMDKYIQVLSYEKQ